MVDLTHEVPPFDIRAGALALARSVGYLGPGVVVGVVDPGVGSDRRAVAVAVAVAVEGNGPRYLLGPDNGLLGWAIESLGGAVAAVALPGTEKSSFDGRDLFAPAAGRLWSGAGLHDIGMPIDPRSLVELAPLVLRVAPGSVEAEVTWVDRFGNVQLAARAGDAGRAGLVGTVTIGPVTSGTVTIGVVTTGTGAGRTGKGTMKGRTVEAFAGLGPDELGLMVDANGHLALVCDRRPAATVLGVRPGDIVTLAPVPAAS